MQGKTIMFEEEQIDFIKDQRKRFDISKFVRDKLSEYMEMVNNG